MIRIGFYITLSIALALGAVWFADHPGTLRLNWQGWEMRLSMGIFFLFAFLYTALCWYLFKLYRWFRTDNPLTSPKRQASRRQKGLSELDLGWSAYAVHDDAAALKHGKKARALLPQDNGPTRLILAVGAQDEKSQNDKKWQAYLEPLQKNQNTRLWALKIALDREKSPQEARAILREMKTLSPHNKWIMNKYFNLLTRLGQWSEAADELNQLAKGKALDPHEQKHLAAVLKYSQALEADIASQKTAARDFAIAALKSDPAFIPAALLLGRYYLSCDDKAKARKVVEATWKLAPHPDLGQFFLKLEPLESPSEKFRRIQKFAGLKADHPDSLNFLAKIALDTEHWAEAKQALTTLTKDDTATRETYHLLARLEMLQKKDQAAATRYTAQAEKAKESFWRCGSCGAQAKNYAPTCPKCQSFGQITWT